MDFPDSNGRRDERRGDGLTLRDRTEVQGLITCGILLLDVQAWNGPTLRYLPSFRAFAALFPLPHIYTSQTHTHTRSTTCKLTQESDICSPVACQRGERCLRVNKVKFTEQVNIRKHRFHFQSTFYVHPTCSSLPEVTVLELDDWCCDHRWESRNRVCL